MRRVRRYGYVGCYLKVLKALIFSSYRCFVYIYYKFVYCDWFYLICWGCKVLMVFNKGGRFLIVYSF